MNLQILDHKKGVCVSNIKSEELRNILLPYVGDRQDYSTFKLFRGIAYTDELDRDGEIATHDYLEQLASKLVGVPVIKNHNWDDVDGIVGRVVKAEVETDGDSEIIRIMFYAVKPEDIENIENGLYYGLSVGSTVQADGKYLVGCTDAYEVSIVTVPAVAGAHITKSKNKTDKEVQSNMELETIKAELEACKSELEAAKAENETLKNKLAEIEQAEFEAEACEVLDEKAESVADELCPANDTVKEVLVDELKAVGFEVVDSAEGAVALKCGKFISFKAFDNNAKAVKIKYTKLGLLGRASVKEVETKKEVKSLDFTSGTKTSTKSVAVKRGQSVKFN